MSPLVFQLQMETLQIVKAEMLHLVGNQTLVEFLQIALVEIIHLEDMMVQQMGLL